MRKKEPGEKFVFSLSGKENVIFKSRIPRFLVFSAVIRKSLSFGPKVYTYVQRKDGYAGKWVHFTSPPFMPLDSKM